MPFALNVMAFAFNAEAFALLVLPSTWLAFWPFRPVSSLR
jgi:hypothetical protein